MNEARFIGPNSIIKGEKLEIHGRCGKPGHLGTWIGYFVTITAGSDRVRIGPCVDISSYSYISTHYSGPRAVELGEKLVGPVEIGDHSYIGPYALIEANTKIGDHCIVGAYSRVRGKFPPYSFIGGNPATVLRTIPSRRREESAQGRSAEIKSGTLRTSKRYHSKTPR